MYISWKEALLVKTFKSCKFQIVTISARLGSQQRLNKIWLVINKILFEITQVWKIEDSLPGILNNTFAELWLDRVFAVLFKNI